MITEFFKQLLLAAAHVAWRNGDDGLARQVVLDAQFAALPCARRLRVGSVRAQSVGSVRIEAIQMATPMRVEDYN